MLPFFLQISIIFLMIDLAPILGIQIAVIGTSCINNPKISIPSIYSSKLNPSSCTLKKIKEFSYKDRINTGVLNKPFSASSNTAISFFP